MPGKRAIVLVDHGSRQPEANAVLAELAAMVQALAPDRLVYHAHMELAGPSLAEAVERSVREGATEIVVHPYFLTPGRHASEDIPRLAREAAARHAHVNVRVSAPLGLHPKLAEVVLERIGD
ncbi:MAG: sirohydrochlorin cobaltochelatase [Deltaproteobacteria bacterium]|nr:MAG: sirohydrochlorin cobaltochelatase [Deltaproteobacteria bacterium]